MAERFDDERVAVVVRGLVIASEAVLAKLRDPAFLALNGEPASPVDRAAPEAERAQAAGWRDLARQGGELAKRGVAVGVEKWSTERPGSPHWYGLSVDQRCDWWLATLGRASSVLAALPGLTGALGENLPVGDLISAAGQGLLLCAIAQEHGVLDRDDQVELLGTVVLDRTLTGTVGRAQRRQAEDDAGDLVPEMAGRAAASGPALATGLALVRMGRSLRTLEEELDRRPRAHSGRRLAGAVPVVGAVAHYRGEREGLRRVSERGREWCRVRAAASAPALAAVSRHAIEPTLPDPSIPSIAWTPFVASPSSVPRDVDDEVVTAPLAPGDLRRAGGAVEPVIGTKVKDKHAKAWLAALAPHLYPGEAVTALARTALLRPLCDVVAVTNARVMAFQHHEPDHGAKRQVSADDVARAEVVKKTFGPNTLVVTTRSGEELSFGGVAAPDEEMLLGVVRDLATTGSAPDARRAMAHQDESDRRGRAAWDVVEVIGTVPNEAAWKTLKDHCSPGEVPWFVVGAGTAGVLAAFTDRLMIVKVGAMTSMMAGSLGGGRVTTFPYAEITGIEYNSGMVAGVLEVLTPSYNGTANRDYWRGTRSSRNADANDPWTLSNTVPMPRELYQRALPRLTEMRARITEIKRPTVVTAPPASGHAARRPEGIADQIGKLAALRDQGLLTDGEFEGAKRRVLDQQGLT